MPGTKIINVLRDDKLEDILHIFRSTPAEEVIFVLPKRAKAFSDEASFAALAEESQELSKGVLILSENPEINAIASSYDLGILTSEDSDKPKSKSKKVSSKDDDEEEENNKDNDDDSENESVGDESTKDEFAEDETVTAEPISYGGSSGGDEGEEEEIHEEIDESQDEEDKKKTKEEQGFAPVEYQEEAVFGDPPVETVLAVAPKSPKSMNDILGPNPDDAISLKVNKKIEKPVNVGVKKELAKTPLPAQDFKERNVLDEIQNVWQRREIPKKSYPNPVKNFKLPNFSIGGWFSGLSKKTLYIYGLGVVIIFGVVIYVSIGKADIVIKPRAHALKFDLKISASDKFTAVDLDLKKIPGQLFSVEKKIEETFSASGEKDVVQKARGKLTVYNEYGTTPQVLIATTRFESVDGLILRTLKTVTVPGTKVQNGKIIPGSIEVEVIADKAGEVYNIEPGKFTIPAFKEKGDNDRYGKFYGRSDSAMKGGIVGKAKVVTEEDYVKAKKRIEERIISETENELKNQAAGLKILGLSSPTIKEIVSSAQIDEATDSFVVSGSAELHTVGFKDEDLNKLIIIYVGSINSDIVTFAEKLKVDFKNIKFNNETKILEFVISVDGPTFSKVNEEKIVTDLMGKGEDYIKDYIKGVEGVSSARVVLSPFWVWKVPKDKNRIHVRMEY